MWAFFFDLTSVHGKMTCWILANLVLGDTAWLVTDKLGRPQHLIWQLVESHIDWLMHLRISTQSDGWSDLKFGELRPTVCAPLHDTA